MKHLIFIFLAIFALGMASSCSSKADKLKEQQLADSLRKDSIARQMREDSIQREQKEEELKDEKIAFLKQFYENAVYPVDDNIGSIESYSKNFIRHLSDKVAKALSDYDEGIDDGSGNADQKEGIPALYVLGDEGDYGNEGPKITYDYEGNGWFKVTISGTTTLKIKVDSDKDDDENFIITGVEIPNYNISVKP